MRSEEDEHGIIPSRDNILLVIEDTGKGISTDFLRSKAFTPFTQENSLSPGTGLGFSLTKSVVDMLEGEIGLESTVGEGTKRTITIPMLRGDPLAAGKDTREGTPSGTNTSTITNHAESVKTLSQDRYISFYESEPTTADTTPHSSLAKLCLSSYLSQWFDHRLPDWSPDVRADVVITNDVDLAALLSRLQGL